MHHLAFPDKASSSNSPQGDPMRKRVEELRYELQSFSIFYQLDLLRAYIHLLFTIPYYYIISITMNPNNVVSALPEFHYITGL